MESTPRAKAQAAAQQEQDTVNLAGQRVWVTSQGKWAGAKAGNHLDYPAQIYTVSLFTIVKMED